MSSKGFYMHHFINTPGFFIYNSLLRRGTIAATNYWPTRCHVPARHLHGLLTQDHHWAGISHISWRSNWGPEDWHGLSMSHHKSRLSEDKPEDHSFEHRHPGFLPRVQAGLLEGCRQEAPSWGGGGGRDPPHPPAGAAEITAFSGPNGHFFSQIVRKWNLLFSSTTYSAFSFQLSIFLRANCKAPLPRSHLWLALLFNFAFPSF